LWCEHSELRESHRREVLQTCLTLLGELEADDAVIVGVLSATHETRSLGPIDELDRAVVLEQQIGRGLTYRRPTFVRMTSHGEEQLMLHRRDPGRFGRL